MLHRTAVPLVFVDVGAKGKLEIIDSLASISEVHAFEPNPLEFKKLEETYKNIPFNKLVLNRTALSAREGIDTLHIYEQASMSSLLEGDLDNYEKHFGLYSDFGKWKKGMNLLKKEEIKTQTLDSYFGPALKHIDFLKIDTQGTELEILKGALNLLRQKKISLIKLEVTTIPVYKNQALFSEIDLFLRNLNYSLVDFITYREETNPVFGRIIPKHSGPCGDAIYMLNDPTAHDILLRKSLILMWLGYISVANRLLDSTQLNPREKSVVFGISQPTLKLRIKSGIKNLVPPLLWRFLRRFNK